MPQLAGVLLALLIVATVCLAQETIDTSGHYYGPEYDVDSLDVQETVPDVTKVKHTLHRVGKELHSGWVLVINGLTRNAITSRTSKAVKTLFKCHSDGSMHGKAWFPAKPGQPANLTGIISGKWDSHGMTYDMWFRNKKFRFLGSLSSWGNSNPSHRKLVHMLKAPTNINETAHMMGQYWWGKVGSGYFDFQLAYVILDGMAPPVEETEWPILKDVAAMFAKAEKGMMP